jgi:hypothetical protein
MAKITCLGEALGDREPGPGVSAIEDVVRRFRPAREPAHPTELTKRRELIAPTGQKLVRVRLVTCVPDDPIPRRLEQPVEGDRQLDDAE